MSTSFSKRHGFARQKITVREDAPKQLRADILFVIHELCDAHGSSDLGRLCDWLEPNLKRSSYIFRERNSYAFSSDKFDKALMECPWFRFYDCVEETFQFLVEQSPPDFTWLAERVQKFEDQVNEAFEQNGVGWKLVEGQLQIREDEGFEQTFESALKTLESRGLTVAVAEMREAWADLSRRPKPDSTGAIQHAMNSLESAARERAGNRKATLGQLIPKLGLRAPLDTAVVKLWGYASDSARHGREGNQPSRREAALVVGACAAVAAFLSNVDE